MPLNFVYAENERLYKSTLQRVKMESVFHDLYHTLLNPQAYM